MKTFILSLIFSMFTISNLFSQSNFYFTGYLESQTGADAFYHKSKFLNGAGIGYNIGEYFDIHTVFSYTGDTWHAGTGNKDYTYVKDAYSILIGTRIKPFGTIVKNPLHDFGHFTPYMGISIKKRTIYDFCPFNTTKDSEWILGANLGAEFSLTKLLSIYGFSGIKYLVSEADELSSYKMKSEITHPSYNWGFGLKVNI